MSWNVQQPITGELAAAKANKGGDDLTNPATWRTNLDVPTNLEARRRALPEASGVFLDTAGTTKITSRLGSANAIGSSPFSIWLRFVVPQQANVPAAGAGLFGITNNTAGGNANDLEARIEASSVLNIYFRANASATLANATRWTVNLAGFEGQLVDFVFTRSGTTLSAFINGSAVTVSQNQPGTDGYAHAADALTGQFYQTGVFSTAAALGERIWRSVLFNRALSLADIADLISNGVNPADQWGTTTPVISPSVLNGGFETAGSGGTDAFASWIEATTGSSTVTRDTVVFSPNGGAASAKITLDGANSFANVTSAASHVAGKRYRLSLDYRHNGSAAVPLQYNRGGGVDVVTSETWSPNVWNAVSLEYISNGSGTLNLSRTGTITLGSSIWFDSVTWTRIGAIVNLDLTPGVGLFFPDRSTNFCHGESDGGITHTLPREYGHMTVVRTLLHSDISATAGTTKLFDLPPNCGIVFVELDRTQAMDAGITINVGNGGAATRYASGLAASSSGPIGAASSFQTSESSSATTAIFIQKSGATTTGSLRARITYQIRG